MDHLTGGHRPTGFLSPVLGLHDTARKSRRPKLVRFGHSGPILTPHCKEDKHEKHSQLVGRRRRGQPQHH